jgi:hypothetical protein
MVALMSDGDLPTATVAFIPSKDKSANFPWA